MTDAQIIPRLIGEIKREQAELAESAMLRPKKDLFSLGEVAGVYQGLQKALDTLDGILSDTIKSEKSL